MTSDSKEVRKTVGANREEAWSHEEVWLQRKTLVNVFMEEEKMERIVRATGAEV